MPLKAVVFDVGETLVDETRQWNEWADWLGVERARFFAIQRDIITKGEHHRRVFEILQPGFNLAKARAERAAAGQPALYTSADLFDDVMPCLKELRRRGLSIGIAGNQPETAETALAAMGMPTDFIASSARWRTEKPAPEFFARVVEESRCAAAEIAYVGDRLDNDVLPARDCGMIAVFLERGIWGRIHATWPQANQAHIRIKSLAELPAALTPYFTGSFS